MEMWAGIYSVMEWDERCDWLMDEAPYLVDVLAKHMQQLSNVNVIDEVYK